MKKKVSGLDIAVKTVRLCDKLVNIALGLIVVAMLMYGAFGLLDTYRILAGASGDSSLLKYKPQIDTEEVAGPTLSDLQALNPDVVGWLTVDGTKIDYPVVQGEDNYEYLNIEVDGSYSLSGTIFLDYRNDREFGDFYSLLYGHHMAGEVMFGVLPRYQEQDFFDEHREGTIVLGTRAFTIEIFSCVYSNAADNLVFNPTEMQTKEEKERFLAYIKQKSVCYADIGVSANDRIIGLSTCYEIESFGRIIVYGVLEERPMQSVQDMEEERKANKDG